MSQRTASLASDRIPDSAAAFAEWVNPHVAVMAGLAARLASDPERDDVVQEALLRAWKKRSQYDAKRGDVRTWLLAITAGSGSTNTATSPADRRRGRPGGPEPSVDERLDVESAVSRLSPRQRLAVNCFYFVDLSITAGQV